ncbi:MAG TPA: Ku protein [Candidatus Acidoferrum sp.]|nr:Ku protein [Candidatus Acidoferrum sp.]
MRAIWKGTISFGLVSIPIALFTATRREELKFHWLRASDLSPIKYKRVSEEDGQEVPWDQIVKGYEYEKGKFVVLTDEDFARVDVEAAQTVEIMEFVPLKEVDPLFFYKPYYMEAQKGGDRAYIVLRQALADSGKIGIAKVIIKTRQHLAAIKPEKAGLMLELMHFPEELVDASEFRAPSGKAPIKPEMTMAAKLIDTMSGSWQPNQYKDDYREMLEKIVHEKIHAGGRRVAPPPKRAEATNVVDLVSVLQDSINATKAKVRGPSKHLKKAA